MKIHCKCGHIIIDSTDDLPFKGHVIADQNLHSIFEMIDDSIEMSSDTLKERQARCMHVRSNFPRRFIWQCNGCDRLYLDNADNELVSFTPEEGKSSNILKA